MRSIKLTWPTTAVEGLPDHAHGYVYAHFCQMQGPFQNCYHRRWNQTAPVVAVVTYIALRPCCGGAKWGWPGNGAASAGGMPHAPISPSGIPDCRVCITICPRGAGAVGLWGGHGAVMASPLRGCPGRMALGIQIRDGNGLASKTNKESR